MLEQRLERGVAVGERDETIPHVARGQDAELLAQATRTAAIIGHRDNAGQRILADFTEIGGHAGEALEHRRQACATAEGRYTRTGRSGRRLLVEPRRHMRMRANRLG